MKRGFGVQIVISIIHRVIIGMVMVICIPIAFAP